MEPIPPMLPMLPTEPTPLTLTTLPTELTEPTPPMLPTLPTPPTLPMPPMLPTLPTLLAMLSAKLETSPSTNVLTRRPLTLLKNFVLTTANVTEKESVSMEPVKELPELTSPRPMKTTLNVNPESEEELLLEPLLELLSESEPSEESLILPRSTSERPLTKMFK